MHTGQGVGVWRRGLGQYSHGLHGRSAGAAVALGAVGVLHRPVELFPHGAGQATEGGVAQGSGGVQRYAVLSHGSLSATERTVRGQAHRRELPAKRAAPTLLTLTEGWWANSSF